MTSVETDTGTGGTTHPIEFIGMMAPTEYSEIIPPPRNPVDASFTRSWARAHEEAGFDRVLIGYFGHAPDGFIVASYVLAATERMGVLLAHRPGFVSPPVAARKLATLDQYSGGRLAVHIISGGDDAEQQRDGDWLDVEARYRRTDEYVGILKRVWTEDEPFDHEGEFYKLKGTYSQVRCAQQPHIPVFFGGSSPAAIATAGRHADVYALWGEPLAEAAEHIAKVRAAAAQHGRNPAISLSTRPILGRTEEEAWDRARRILAQIESRSGGRTPNQPANVGSRRLLEAAARQDVYDRCLWMPLATASGARGNSTALVGTPETVAKALLDYHEIGVTTFLIRGYEPFNDTVDYGRHLLPLVHQELAQRRGPAELSTAPGPTGA